MAYTLSRLVFHTCGIRWDSTFLAWGWQALDPKWMREDLARSIWYLHSQPPLFNLGVGLALKLSPESYDLWLQTAFRIMGLTMFMAMAKTLDALGVRKWIALPAVLLFLLSPSSVVYENWLFYTYPTAALLALCAFSLMRWVQTRKTLWSLAFVSLMVAVVLTRSLFQWFWVVAVLAMLWWLLREHRRSLLQGSIAPMGLLVLFLIKNLVVFGFLGTSSWSGMNLGRIAFLSVPQETKDRLVAEGKIPQVCSQRTFQSLSAYQGAYSTVNPHPEVAILSDTLAHGTINFHHWDFVEVSRQYGKGSKTMILTDPKNYVRNVAVATTYWFQPPAAYSFVQNKTQQVNGYNRIWNYLVMGTPKNPEDAKAPGKGEWDQKRTLTLLTALVYALVSIVTLRFAWRHRRSFRQLNAERLAVASFCLATVAYIFLLSTATEVGENLRFRFLTLPLGWVLLGLIAEHFARNRNRKSRG